MISITPTIKRMIGFVTLFGYCFGLLIFVPVHLIQMADMNMPVEHCLLMGDVHPDCALTIFQHFGVWYAWLQSFAPLVKEYIILSLVVLAVFLFSFSPPKIKSYHYARQQRQKKKTPLLTLLFSQGLLHSKAH